MKRVNYKTLCLVICGAKTLTPYGEQGYKNIGPEVPVNDLSRVLLRNPSLQYVDEAHDLVLRVSDRVMVKLEFEPYK